jgi:hypothetical protein
MYLDNFSYFLRDTIQSTGNVRRIKRKLKNEGYILAYVSSFLVKGLEISSASISEMSEKFYQTTRRNIPEDAHLRTQVTLNT